MKKLITVMAMLAMVAVALPAMASDVPGYAVTVGGRVKVDAGWQILPGNDDDKFVQNNSTDSTIVNFFNTTNTNSYLRVLFTSADKTTGAHLEFGLGSRENMQNDGVLNGAFAGTRFCYGWWKTGSCRLVIGHFAGRLGDRYYAGSSLGLEKSLKSNLESFGFIGWSRNTKIALQMEVNENFSFEVAIGQPGTEGTITDVFGANTGSTNNWLPRLEVVADIKFGSFMISPGFGVSYSKWNFDGAGADDENLFSFLLQLPAKYTAGPLAVIFNAYYAQNRYTDWTGEYGSESNMRRFQFGGNPVLPVYTAADGVDNTKEWGLGLAVNYAISEQLGINAGLGVAQLKNSAWEVGDSAGKYTKFGAFVAIPYKLTSNFTIAPEIGYYNYGKNPRNDDEKRGDEWLLGVHFQFLF